MCTKCAVCGEKAPLSCGRCKSVEYCGKEHQTQDWQNHITTCKLKMCTKCAVCGETAPLSCGRCKSVEYCGKEHQAQDWQNHKTACKLKMLSAKGAGSIQMGLSTKSCERDHQKKDDWQNHEKTTDAFKVLTSHKLGSYVVASRDIKKGEIIVNEEPLVIGPNHLTPVYCCVGCLKTLPFSAECQRCSWPICGQTCPGLKNRMFHGAECDFLTMTKPLITMRSAHIIVPLRMLLLQITDLDKWKVVKEMIINKAIPSMHSKKSKESKSLFEETILKPTAGTLRTLGVDYSDHIITQIFSLLDACAVEGKLARTGRMVGAGEVASIMEHSCLPNTTCVFDLTRADVQPFQCRIIVRAARDICRGERLTRSFVRVLMCTYTRQQTLKTNRGSYCKCERCMDPTELGTNFNTLKCLNCPGDVLPIDHSNMLLTQWKCHGKCEGIYPAGYVSDLLNQTMKDTEDAHIEDLSLSELEELLEKLEKTFHASHHFCVKLKTRLSGLYGTKNLYEQKKSCELKTSSLPALGLSGLPGGGNRISSRMTDEELERKAELCQEVLNVIGQPCFVSTDGALTECLVELSLTTAEIANRKKASGEWSAESVKEALEESDAIMKRAMDIKFQSENPTGGASSK